jgi:hypothetical protein
VIDPTGTGASLIGSAGGSDGDRLVRVQKWLTDLSDLAFRGNKGLVAAF